MSAIGNTTNDCEEPTFQDVSNGEASIAVFGQSEALSVRGDDICVAGIVSGAGGIKPALVLDSHDGGTLKKMGSASIVHVSLAARISTTHQALLKDATSEVLTSP